MSTILNTVINSANTRAGGGLSFVGLTALQNNFTDEPLLFVAGDTTISSLEKRTQNVSDNISLTGEKYFAIYDNGSVIQYKALWLE